MTGIELYCLQASGREGAVGESGLSDSWRTEKKDRSLLPMRQPVGNAQLYFGMQTEGFRIPGTFHSGMVWLSRLGL
jgi:hypothetical protein